jgi:hypothetical protein
VCPKNEKSVAIDNRLRSNRRRLENVPYTFTQRFSEFWQHFSTVVREHKWCSASCICCFSKPLGNSTSYLAELNGAMRAIEFFFDKLGERSGIKRQHRHPNEVGTPRNLHPMPPNSKKFIKKGGEIITKEGELGQNPQKKTERKNKQK